MKISCSILGHMKHARQKLITIPLIVVFCMQGILAPHITRASQFDPSFIITNSDIEDFESMSLKEIQDFLKSLNSFLSLYVTEDAYGTVRSAAEIIYNAARTHYINPKWIITTLQKEQSLVTAQETPIQDRLDWAMGYAVCDSCSKDDPAIQKFRGFGKQVDRAAARTRQYLITPHAFNFKAGGTYTISGETVTIKNQATAALYIYTPHLHGNLNFWRIWSRWFSTYYPNGTLVQVAGEPGVWLIEDGRKRAITSKAVLVSRFDPSAIVTVSPTDIASYPRGFDIKFPNYTLVQESSTGIKYLLVNDQKKSFENEEVFRRLGFNPDEVEIATNSELALYKEGSTITLTSAYPLGQLIQDTSSGGVYFVQDGVKHPIVSREIMKHNFPLHTIIKGDPATLQGFQTGQKVIFKDGKLIKSSDSPVVYVISEGKKREIANEETFLRLGYRWNDIITTTPEALAIHQTGDTLNTTTTVYQAGQ